MLPLLLFGVIGLILLMVLYVYPTFIAPMFEEESLPEPQSDESLKLTETGVDLLPETPTEFVLSPFGDERSFGQNYVSVSHSDSEFVLQGMHVCLHGHSYRVSHKSNRGDTELVYFEEYLQGTSHPGDAMKVGDCPDNPWAPPEAVVANTDPNALTVVANVPYHIEHGYDAGAANFFGIARVDGEKLESGDFVCIAGDQYVVQSVNSHSEQIDYVYLDRILVRSVPVGTNVTIGQCPSQPACLVFITAIEEI